MASTINSTSIIGLPYDFDKSLNKNGVDNIKVSLIIEWITYVVLSGSVSIFGIIANIINIIVFIKQGAFREHGSVNLLGLAISDLLCVTSMLYLSFCFAIILIDPKQWPWAPFDFMLSTAAWPHVMFAQITRVITAYISLERCVCVVWPFRVRNLFNPKRSILVIIFIFIAFVASYSPVFIKQRVSFQFDSMKNSTILKLDLDSDWMLVVDVMWYVNSLAFNVGSVLVVIVCTLVTASRVQFSSMWRETSKGVSTTTRPNSSKDVGVKSSNAHMNNNKLLKEKRLIRMIVFISAVFIVCYIPDFVFLLAYSIEPRVRILGDYHQLAIIMYGFTVTMETFNSSINIFIYYKMSTKYRKVLRQLMRQPTDENSAVNSVCQSPVSVMTDVMSKVTEVTM